ncbi:excisionase family DNA binding protein [Arthrobacter sp. 2762]
MAEERPYLTAQEMAAKYRLSDHTVRRKVMDGVWPCDRIGRLYRFSPAQQDEIARSIEGNSLGSSGYDKDRVTAALRRLSEANGAT